MIVIGTFIRGPGWMWFWPTQTWDAARVDFAVNRNLDDALGVNGSWLAHLLPAHWQPFSMLIAHAFFGSDSDHALFYCGVLSSALAGEFNRVQPQDLQADVAACRRLTTLLFLALMISLPIKILCGCCCASSMCGRRRGSASNAAARNDPPSENRRVPWRGGLGCLKRPVRIQSLAVR